MSEINRDFAAEIAVEQDLLARERAQMDILMECFNSAYLAHKETGDRALWRLHKIMRGLEKEIKARVWGIKALGREQDMQIAWEIFEAAETQEVPVESVEAVVARVRGKLEGGQGEVAAAAK